MERSHSRRRTPPSGMPSEAPRPPKGALEGAQKPRDALPPQKPVTDEAPAVRPPSRLKRALKRIGLGLLLALALAFAYVFLLLGEPEEEAKLAQPVVEEAITLPMSALDMPGEANVQSLADSFGQPVLSLYGALSMQKARIYDTAFGGGYARRVTLTYAFADGALLTVDSLRPTAAVTLLGDGGYRLNASSLDALAGLDAARMDSDAQTCIFTQSDTAVYAVTCPAQHAGELNELLRQTTLIAPSGE